MALQRTNIPHLMQNKKTGVLVNNDTSRFELIKEQRRRYKEQKSLENRVSDLEARIAWLESKVRE